MYYLGQLLIAIICGIYILNKIYNLSSSILNTKLYKNLFIIYYIYISKYVQFCFYL